MDIAASLVKLRSDTLLGRLLRLPLRLVPSKSVLPILQGPLRGTKWIVESGIHRCWIGVYEIEKQHALVAAVRAGDVVYDIGANAGFYTLLSCSLAGPAGRVVSFEPLPRNLAFLRRHVAINDLRQCTIMPVAVSDHDGTGRFAEGKTPSEGRLCAEGRDSFDVQTVTLDRLVELGRIPPPRIVKCDVEGAEHEVLQGAIQVLKAHRPIVFLATHGRDVHARCCDLLKTLGYVIASLDGAPIEETDEIVAVPD